MTPAGEVCYITCGWNDSTGDLFESGLLMPTNRRNFVQNLPSAGDRLVLLERFSNHIFTFAALQVKLAEIDGVDAEDISLSCEGAPLQSAALVSTLTSVELDYNVLLVGGKVHGSLARAGKVKGQTPKVEKQEKKKKKTGRCKRRIQFNRRFVNVVAAFGRRKGPNAHA